MDNNRIFPNIKLPNFKLAVRCITYNHAPYIHDALKGFISQKTDFPFLAIIIDDASTDGEQDVIKKYMEEEFSLESNNYAECWENELSRFIFARHPSNQECYFIVMLLKRNLYKEWKKKKSLYYPWADLAEYSAECEGDDYWTDSAKLQKQIDFMESHSDYAMCFHAALQHWEDNRLPDQLFRKIEDREYSGPEIFKDWTVATASVVIRREIFHSRIFESALKNSKFIFSDIVLFLSCAANGKVYGMSDVMSVYRRQETGFVFKYDLSKHVKSAYHYLEIYKVFGKQYKALSIQKFVDTGTAAFLNAKGEGKIYYRLLFDLVRYAPQKTFSFFYNMIRNKI